MKHSIGKFNASCGGLQWKVLFWSLCHNSDNPNFPKSASMVDFHPGVISKLSTSGKPFDLSVVHFIPCIGMLLVRLFEIVRVRLLRLHLQTLFFSVTTGLFSLFKVSTETLRLVDECFTKKTVDSVVVVGILRVRSCPLLFGINCFSILVSPWCKNGSLVKKRFCRNNSFCEPLFEAFSLIFLDVEFPFVLNLLADFLLRYQATACYVRKTIRF